jgi:hypothetical protein
MPDWQNLIVIACIAAAGGYLALRAWRVIATTKNGRCGTCSDCDSSQQGAKPFLSIESISHSKDVRNGDAAN